MGGGKATPPFLSPMLDGMHSDANNSGKVV